MAAGLPNYGLLDTMASGLKEGMLAYQTTQNAQRQNQLMNLAYGVQQGQNGLEYTPQKQQELDTQRQLQTQQSQHQLDALDPDSDVSQNARQLAQSTGVKLKGNESAADLKDFSGLLGQSVKNTGLLQSAQARAQAQNSSPMAQNRMDIQTERLHNQNLAKVNNDPTATQLINTTNNLQNAMSNFKNGGATPQEFNELQQAVRSNVGIKGTSGVDERSETYLKSLGISKDKLTQFLSGNPQSVMESDPNFASQIMNVANLEIGNKKQQYQAQVGKLTAGHNSFYSKHPELKADFDAAVQAGNSQMGVGGQTQAAPASGLLNQSQSAAAQPHPQDSQAMQWAKANPNDPRSAAILKANQ